MFRKLTSLLIISLSVEAWSRAPGTHSQLRSELQKVSKGNLVEWVNGFVTASMPSRMVGTPGHAKARDFLIAEIRKLDAKSSGTLTVSALPAQVEAIKKFYQNDFDAKLEGKVPSSHPEYVKWKRFTEHMKDVAEARKSYPVENIVWEKAGLDAGKVLVVSAHYDTISHDKKTLMIDERSPMPGANYNASGVAAALGLVKVLANVDLNYSVRIVFLDWQGIGFHGSELFARELSASGKKVFGVVNLEMLGQDTSFFDKTKKTGNLSVYHRDLPEESRWVRRLVEHGSKMTSKVNFEAKASGFEFSDNIRFWEAGFLSATFSQNWEDDFNPKFYQTSQDTPETLNHETLWHAFQYVGGSVGGVLLDLTK